MKQKLLFLIAFLSFGFSGASQVMANQPADITQCSNPVFDLTTTIPQILMGQDMTSSWVTFYLTQADASSGANPIPNAGAFTATQTFTTIWARAENQAGFWDITSFQVISTEMFDYNVPPAQYDCDAAEFGTFNLISLVPQMVSPQQDYDVWFFENEIDAINVNNPNAIFNTGDYTMVVPNSQTVYAAIVTLSGFDCRAVVPIQLVAGNCTGNTISGTVRYNENGDDCQTSTVGMAGIKVSNLNGNDFRVAYTNADGDFQFSNLLEGENTTSIFTSDLPSGVSVVGSDSFVTNVVEDTNGVGNFCLNSVPLTDAAIYFFPVGQARPGFQSQYAFRVENKGNQVLSGSASVTFDLTKLSFVGTNVPSLTAAANQLTLPFSELSPQGVIFGYVYFLVATPPTVNGGDLLNFTASVQVIQADEDGTNDSVAFAQTVVNSYDPNDITCLEGATITPEQADGYLHYTIRFQNSGTADAINVRVENELSALLNWNTFQPVAASHTYFTERVGNTVNFRFNNINLPAEQDDEPASHGFVTYRIKPVGTINVGDAIPNSAAIYFDFNEPIITDGITTTVQLLSVPKNNFSALQLFPNPASGSVYLRTGNIHDFEVEISDVRGANVFKKQFSANGSESVLDVSGWNRGVYFVKVRSEGISLVKKLLIK